MVDWKGGPCSLLQAMSCDFLVLIVVDQSLLMSDTDAFSGVRQGRA